MACVERSFEVIVTLIDLRLNSTDIGVSFGCDYINVRTVGALITIRSYTFCVVRTQSLRKPDVVLREPSLGEQVITPCFAGELRRWIWL